MCVYTLKQLQRHRFVLSDWDNIYLCGLWKYYYVVRLLFQEDSSFRDFVVNICMENINRKASMKLNSSGLKFTKILPNIFDMIK